MVVAGLALAALAGCYNAHPSAGAPCDLALDNCPTGQHCTMTAGGAFCYEPNTGLNPDSGNGSGDPDGPRPDNAPSCYGTGLVNNLCGLMPTNDVAISAARTVNTAMVGGSNCDQIIAGGGASICLVVARDFSIASGITLSATGANPLVIVGTNSITIGGTLDVSSHHGGADGPGAQSSCGTGTEGAVGVGPASTAGGGGGGAGGSFGTIGGAGGVGYKSGSTSPGASGGTPTALVTLTSLKGGCPGGRGGYGHGSPPGGDGAGGHGGGAVYLITGGSITITGVVDASGAGADGGTDGFDSSGGGGGGGAGGFIGLDTPALNVSGAVYANGGGGGGGGGTQPDPSYHGGPGSDPSSPTAAASGGAGGTGGGGGGGSGYAGTTAPTIGGNGNGNQCAAGGGGGGAGIIKIYGATAPNGTFSPPPS